MLIKSIQFEHLKPGSVLGIGATKPRISWKVQTKKSNWKQTKYEIRSIIQEPIEQIEDVGVTFVKESSESHLVEWPFEELNSRQRAYVQVRVWGSGSDQPSPWSDLEFVETGILSTSEWTAKLIESSINIDTSKANPEVLFKKSFVVKAPIRSVKLYVTAHGVYDFEVNGLAISNDFLQPGWSSYDYRLRQAVYDLSSAIVDGTNVIGFRLAEGWYSGRLGFLGGLRNIYGEKVGLFAEIYCQYADGSSTTIVTDDTWECTEGPIRSAELYDGEVYDARYEVSNWSKGGTEGQWSSVLAKDINQKIDIFLPTGPTAKPMEYVKPQKLIVSPSGKKIIDFGQNLVGYLQIALPQAKSGHTFSLHHTEVLENGESGHRPLRVVKAADSYTYNGEEADGFVWHPRFTFHGFRYARVENWPLEDIDLERFTAVVCYNDFERTGWFKTSDAMVNRLFENILWSMKGNFLEVPSDCPQRDERLGWTADIQIFTPTALYLYDCAGMITSWLRDLYVEQIEYGGAPGVVVPNILHKYRTSWLNIPPVAVWQDATVIIPWELYRSTGDIEILKKQYDSMKMYTEWIPKDSDLLWKPQFQLGDWLDPSAPPDQPIKAMTDSQLVANAYLVALYDIMVKTCQVLGNDKDAKHYTSLRVQAREAFRKRYILADGEIASDTQTAYALGIYYDLFEPDELPLAAKRLVKVVEHSQYKISTGFVGTPIICHALTKVGHVDVAYKMLMTKECPSWLYPVTMGATTMWERWDSMLPNGQINPGEMTSFNHYAFGSVGQWLYSVVGGLQQSEVGWKKVVIKPAPSESFVFAEAKYDSPYGIFESKWNAESNIFKLFVVIPPNAEALIILPNNETHTVGSGSYHFSCVL
ncbi:bacterial alpha-L-rhamnosidase-domain-containing protein [Dipodascopsis uninucleata]